MGIIRRLADIDKERLAPNEQPDSVLPLVENELSGPVEPEKPDLPEEAKSELPDGDEKPVEQRDKTPHRATLDYLNILKSLEPVFKAATIYPGHDAAPEQIGAAVKKMSRVSVDLADYIAANGDMLELDAAWARRQLHDFTAELVASHWVSTVIAKGGVVPGHSPDISVDYFAPAIRSVMELPIAPVGKDRSPDLSLEGAVNLSMLKGLTPIAMEIEKYETIVSANIPDVTISANALIAEIGQSIMEQSLQHHDRFVAEHSESTDDDRRALMQALIGHASAVMLSSLEYCRGEVLGQLKAAGSVEEGAAIISQPQFTHGFPLNLLKTRAEASLKRLVGTSLYALSMIKQSQPVRQNGGNGEG